MQMKIRVIKHIKLDVFTDGNKESPAYTGITKHNPAIEDGFLIMWVGDDQEIAIPECRITHVIKTYVFNDEEQS